MDRNESRTESPSARWDSGIATRLLSLGILVVIALFLGVSHFSDQARAVALPRTSIEIIVLGLCVVILLLLARHARDREGGQSRWQETECSRKRVGGDRETYSKRLTSLYAATRRLAVEQSASQVSEGILQACLDLFDGDEAALIFREPESGRFAAQAVLGHEGRGLESACVPLAEEVARTRSALLIHPEDRLERLGREGTGPSAGAALLAPILAGSGVLGVLYLANHAPHFRYAADDLRALQVFADHAHVLLLSADRGDRLRRLAALLETVEPEMECPFRVQEGCALAGEIPKSADPDIPGFWEAL